MAEPRRNRKNKMVHGDDPVPPPPPTFEELVEANRDRVRDLEARGFLPSYIASKTRLPYAVVDAILGTKAPPKKGKSK